MGYQALLFCPDEKTARTVTQVLSELDFSVVPCTEPFAAVKKLMGEHFDAVVVNCDNEQNATLLFKSARNAPNNHSSLAVAVVEGQAGVAKAFRIGANLVLTKPVNVEQAKGTLRVARGLLRKSETAKPATGAASAAVKPAAPIATPSTSTPRRPVSIISTSGAAANAHGASASIAAPEQARPRVVASISEENIDADVDLLDDVHEDAASAASVAPEAKSAASQPTILSSTGKQPSSSAGSGAGAASAPARESKPIITPKHEPSSVNSPEVPIKKAAAVESSSPDEDATAPALTLGGMVESGAKPAGGSKKVLLAVAAVVLVAALGYAVWMQWVRSGGEATPFSQVAKPMTMAAKVPAVAASVAPAAAPANPSSAVAPTSDADSTVAADKGEVKKLTATEQPVTKTVAKPIVVKGGNSRPAAKPVAAADAPAPSLTGIVPATGAALPNLIGSPGKAATPVLQVMHVSQGVSRGLLVKEVPPKYPVPALQRRVEGAVDLQATISKNGDITAVKALSGDAQLAYAAVQAVKQWKYKPYLLDGEPIEIQTQITVNFKLPH